MKAHIAKAGLEINLFAVVQGQGPPPAPEVKNYDGTDHVDPTNSALKNQPWYLKYL